MAQLKNYYSHYFNGKSATPSFDNTTQSNGVWGRRQRMGRDGTGRDGTGRDGTTPATQHTIQHTTESLQKCSASQHLNTHTHDVISCSWSQSSAAWRTEGERERKAVHNIACNTTYTSHRMNAKINTNNIFSSRDVTIAQTICPVFVWNCLCTVVKLSNHQV